MGQLSSPRARALAFSGGRETGGRISGLANQDGGGMGEGSTVCQMLDISDITCEADFLIPR